MEEIQWKVEKIKKNTQSNCKITNNKVRRDTTLYIIIKNLKYNKIFKY